VTTEQIVRDQIERATRDVHGGPDLETAIRSGRRRRLRRRGGLAVAAVAVLGLGATGVHALTGSDGRTVAHDGGRSAPAAGTSAAPAAPTAPTDYVPGTDIDEKLAAIVARHLPALPAPDDVYPSDSHTAGPIADAAWASAEDWQAVYTENGNQVLLITGLQSELSSGCPHSCHRVPGGTMFHEDSSTVKDGTTRWYFGTFFYRADGTFANAWEIVDADGHRAAEARRHISDADLAALVQDPGLTFAGLGAVAP
jgi:hypothetical protein